MKTLQYRRAKIARHPVMRALLHPAITLGGLLVLFALIFLGTLYQTDHGLHEAQKMYFSYGFAWVGGVFPLPGAIPVLWVLSVQLVLTVLFVMPLKASKAGLWVVHLGMLALMFGGFITEQMAVESQLTLAEGETGYYSTSYHEFELAFYERNGDTNTVIAFDAADLKAGRVLNIPEYKSRIQVHKYFRNADAFTSQAAAGPAFISASGIGFLEPRKPEKEVTQNLPGITFTLTEQGKEGMDIVLYGGEFKPLMLTLNDRRVFLQLRRKHYPLDFSMTLTEFVKREHPGTQIASDFESYVDLIDGPTNRNVKIWMNNPLRYQGLTFFQASYSQPPGAPQQSTFAVVTNPGRLVPYVSSIVIFLGLLLHYILALVSFSRKRREA